MSRIICAALATTYEGSTTIQCIQHHERLQAGLTAHAAVSAWLPSSTGLPKITSLQRTTCTHLVPAFTHTDEQCIGAAVGSPTAYNERTRCSLVTSTCTIREGWGRVHVGRQPFSIAAEQHDGMEPYHEPTGASRDLHTTYGHHSRTGTQRRTALHHFLRVYIRSHPSSHQSSASVVMRTSTPNQHPATSVTLASTFTTASASNGQATSNYATPSTTHNQHAPVSTPMPQRE